MTDNFNGYKITLKLRDVKMDYLIKIENKKLNKKRVALLVIIIILIIVFCFIFMFKN